MTGLFEGGDSEAVEEDEEDEEFEDQEEQEETEEVEIDTREPLDEDRVLKGENEVEGDFEGEEGANDDETNPLKSMGLLIIALAFGIFFIALICLINWKIDKCCNCFKKVFKIIKQKVMYSAILRSIIMMYLATAISCCLSFTKFEIHTYSDLSSLGINLAILLFLLWFPLFSMRTLTKN